MYERITVTVPTPGYDSALFPLAGLCRRGNIRQPGPYDFFKLDLSRLRFASVSQVVALTQLHLWANMNGADVTMPGISPNVESYASRMNLYSLVGIRHDEDFVRHPEAGRFVPMRTIREFHDVNPIAKDLTSAVTRRISVDSSVSDAIDFAFGEIMDNIVQHSGSPIGGIAAGQHYPNKGYLELCVSDCGKGIASSMAGNGAYAGLAPMELMVKAFEEGCGEKVGAQFLGTDGAGMGMGLTVAERLIKKAHGMLWAVSMGESVCITERGIVASDNYWFPGTILVMRIPTDKPLVIYASDIYPEKGDPGKFSWSVEEGYWPISEDTVSEDLLW